MDEPMTVARANSIIDALRAREIGRKAGYKEGREAGLREAVARFADLPGMMSGAAVAADILALIDAKEPSTKG